MGKNKQNGRRTYSPMIDILAKMVLKKPKLVKHLIHSVLNLDIQAVEILDGKQIHTIKEKTFVTEVDVLATLDDNSQVIIEIQVATQKAFLQRILFYSSSQYTDNFKKIRQEKKNSTHNSYQFLQPVYVISVLSENYFDDDVPFHNFKLRDEHSKARFTDLKGRELLNFAFLELKKYDESKLTGSLKNWFQYWGNLEIDQTADEEILEADDLLDDSKWKEEVRQMISDKIKYEEDYKAVLDAREDQTRSQVALDMLRNNLPLDLIVTCTKLSLETIKKLQEDNHLTHA